MSAKLILDSISEEGNRLTTFQVKCPKTLIAEIGTHRVFSRNWGSSRAIPTSTFIQKESFKPLFWGKNQPGMQASSEIIENVEEAEKVWQECIDFCKETARKLNELGLHKQWANRPNDWHVMVDGVITSTDWANFLNLRNHKDAQPEIQVLAAEIQQILETSTPTLLKYGEWHLPYILPEEEHYDLELKKKLSAARCARVSIKPFDGDASIEKEVARYDSLITSKPMHASPVEHQATPDRLDDKGWEQQFLHGNFYGWIQNRKTIPGNTVYD